MASPKLEAAVDGDPDEDSVPTGDEWVMDTDPTNGASFLAFDAVLLLYGSNCWDVVWTNEEPPYEIVTNLSARSSAMSSSGGRPRPGVHGAMAADSHRTPVLERMW